MAAEVEQHPTLRSVAPDLAEMTDRVAELMARAEEITSELLKINPEVSKAGGYSEHVSSQLAALKPAQEPEPSERVVSLLGRLLPQKREKLPGNPPAWAEPRQRAMALSEELTAIRDAIERLREPIERRRLEASRELCKLLTPEYDAVVAQNCEVIIALGNAWLHHQQWIDDLRRQGVAFAVLQILFPVDDAFLWELIRQLERACETGRFEREKIPHEWRVWRQKHGGPY